MANSQGSFWTKTKADYSKHISTEGKRGHPVVQALVKCILIKNVKINSVGAGAHKVEEILVFLPNSDPHFPNIWRSRKR